MSKMTDASQRLIDARREAGFETGTEAARAFGWNENTYRSHENGERGLKTAVARKYARAFQVSHWWLISGEGKQSDRRSIRPSFCLGDDGRVTDDVKSLGDYDLLVPVSIPEHAKVLYINTTKLYPRYGIGDLVICWDSELTGYKLDDQKNRWAGEFFEALAFNSNNEAVFGSISVAGDHSHIERLGNVPIRGFDTREFFPVQVIIRSFAQSAMA